MLHSIPPADRGTQMKLQSDTLSTGIGPALPAYLFEDLMLKPAAVEEHHK
jgi:hypothetical protein